MSDKDALTPEHVTELLRAHRGLLDEDTELRAWWRATRRDGRPREKSPSCRDIDSFGPQHRGVTEPSKPYRTGTLDVLVSSRLGPNESQDFIRRAVRAELAKTDEWPVRINARTGVRHAPSVMKWTATFETGPAGVEYH